MIRESVAYWAFGIFFMLYLWIDIADALADDERPRWSAGTACRRASSRRRCSSPVVVATAWLPRLVSAFQESPETAAGGSEGASRARPAPRACRSAPRSPRAADPVVNLLYGSDYAGAVPVLVVLGLCIPPMYVNIMLNQVLIALEAADGLDVGDGGRDGRQSRAQSPAHPADAARYDNGAIGAAIALLVTEVLVVVFGFATVGSAVLDRRALGRFARIAVASAALWVTAYATRPFGPVASLAAAALAFVALVAALRVLTPEETAFLRSGARRARARTSLIGARLASLATLGSAGPPSA